MLPIYIHWPFCLSKCPYCDFNSHEANKFDYNIWLKSYIKEIDFYNSSIKDRKIKSIFFGGGTPSLMSPHLVKGIISHISNIALVSDDTEITLEANPTSVEANKFYGFREAGINRVSVGVQSLIAEDLKKLGRKHNPEEAIVAIRLAKEVFSNYSFDLIYAREGQSLADWKSELKEAMQLAGNHISLYQLTIEKGTPFYAAHAEGKLILPENEIAADMYEFTSQYLEKHGYNGYEISNYAKPGFESVHNLAYWNYDEYLGIGPGAHSRLELGSEVYARMNYNKPEKWLSNIETEGSAIQTDEKLNTQELIDEILMMGLRLKIGITDEKLQKYLGLSFKDVLDPRSLQQFIQNGFVCFDEKYLSLTQKGMLMHSYIVPRLLPS